MKDVTFMKVVNNKVSDEISWTKMSVTGKEKLAHEVCRALWTTVGTNAFNPEYGGSMSSLPQYTFADDEEAKSIISSLIKNVETSVMNNQAGQGLPSEEILDSLRIGSVVVSEADVTVVLYVTSLAGKTTATTVVI